MFENSTEKVIYVYDGTFDGFLSCVYNFYYNRLKPEDIVRHDMAEPSFYRLYTIENDPQQIRRVKYALIDKMGRYNCEFLQKVFLTNIPGKEMLMLNYIVAGFKEGKIIYNLVKYDCVYRLRKAYVALYREREKFLGFVRFYKAGRVYVAKIHRDNNVLPLLANHFAQRFHKQSFVIFDENNKQVLIYSQNRYKIVFVDNIDLPQPDEEELKIRRLWKNFYDTIAIKERENPKCRLSFMPKRYWQDLPETGAFAPAAGNRALPD